MTTEKYSKPYWCSESLTIIPHSSDSTNPGQEYVNRITLITTAGKEYHTSDPTEMTFRSLVDQFKGEQLAEIRTGNAQTIEKIIGSQEIPPWIKERIKSTIMGLPNNF